MPPPVSLPPELTDTIIDHLHDDKPSLSACGMTSRAWIPASRFHLFSGITVTPKTAAPLLTLLESRSSPSSIAPIVRSVELQNFVTSQSSEYPYITLRGIQAATVLMCYLDSVKSLRVSCLELKDAPLSFFEAIFKMVSNLTGVEELHLQWTIFGCFDDFLDIVYSFPKLQWLSMDMVTWTRKANSITTNAKLSDGTSFHLLELGHFSYSWPDVVDWILSRHPIPTIGILRCHFMALQGPSVRRLLASVGHSIVDLRLGYIPGKSPGAAVYLRFN